ncbi:MAG: ABC transporter substrate-binding protein [Chloroflexales bacterium]|nr:ABC transporter substrate-binding protein [Chloroflexales bacterium]
MDRVELAETHVDDDEQRLDDLLARYGDVLEGMSFREIKRFIESTHEIYVINAREATTILTQLGLAQAPALAMALGASFESISLNLERMDLIDTGAIFIYHYPTEDELQAEASQNRSVADHERKRIVPRLYRLIIALITIAILFTACGEQPMAEEAPAPTEGATPVAEGSNTRAATNAPATAAAAPAPITTVQIEGFPAYTPAAPLLEVVRRNATTVRVKHAYGATDIPADPQRIYVSDPATLQILLSLGIRPVGSAIFTPELPLALQEQSAGITLLNAVGGEVNLEQLAALQPDLILGSAEGRGTMSTEQYTTLRQIAPTVAFTEDPFFYWQAATLELGDLFGVPDQANAVLANYAAQIADYRTQVQAVIGDETVTILLLFDATMWLYSVGGQLEDRYVPLSPTGWAYRELGLVPGPEVAKLAGDQFWAEVSLELIPELKADHLVVFPNAYGGEEIGQGLDDYLNTPLWQTVPAVQAGNVHLLTADNGVEGYWTTPYLIEEFLVTLAE